MNSYLQLGLDASAAADFAVRMGIEEACVDSAITAMSNLYKLFIEVCYQSIFSAIAYHRYEFKFSIFFGIPVACNVYICCYPYSINNIVSLAISIYVNVYGLEQLRNFVMGLD